jgi:RNA polymerase sigma-70 factor, ECF subfamily
LSAEDPEVAIRQLLAHQDWNGATDAVLRMYGSEIIGWLSDALRNDADAHDAFSRTAEQLWRSLQSFDGRCSMRTWMYLLARHAVHYIRNQAKFRREQLVSHVPSVAHAVTHIWNTTRRAAVHHTNVYAEIREQLDEDDRLLLVLRVDRNLTWRDIAHVIVGEDATTEQLEQKAATLRKQFERVKVLLRDMAAAKIAK